jgi:hypothetical protein
MQEKSNKVTQSRRVAESIRAEALAVKLKVIGDTSKAISKKGYVEIDKQP